MNVRNYIRQKDVDRLKTLLNYKILLGALLGKFLGDLASTYLYGWVGEEAGAAAGIMLVMALVLIWGELKNMEEQALKEDPVHMIITTEEWVEENVSLS